MGVDKIPVFVCGSYAIGVSVGAEARLAAVRHHSFTKSTDMRFDGLRVDAGKEWIGVGANLHVVHAHSAKDFGDEVAPAPYIESMQNFIPDFAIASRSTKLSIALR